MVDLNVAPVGIAVADGHMSQNVLDIIVGMQVADGQVGHPGMVAHDALHSDDMLRAKVVGEVAEVHDGKENVWARCMSKVRQHTNCAVILEVVVLVVVDA